jgi:Tfp pilus assembly protein PilW
MNEGSGYRVQGSGWNRRKRRGLGTVELLISLAITSMLLVAVGASFSASASVIENNDEFFRATQAARVTMNQLLAYVRRAEVVDVNSATELELFTPDDDDLIFRYNPETDKLMLVTEDIVDDPDYCLASNLSEVTFAADTKQRDDGNGNYTTYVARVSVTLVVTIGDNQMRLTGSTCPRRSLTY